MSVTMVSRVWSVTVVTLVACTPFGTGGYRACFQCGVASARCGGIGSPGADVPLRQVPLLASFPSLHHACHGSLVTPSVCSWPLSLVSLRTRVRDVCHDNLWETHLCNLCVEHKVACTHVLRDRPDDSHGVGGLLLVGGPVADALWF